MTQSTIKTSVISTVTAAALIAICSMFFSMWGQVQANTKHREESDKILENLIQMRQDIAVMKNDIKYIKRDINKGNGVKTPESNSNE